jgi:hypothetical protein
MAAPFDFDDELTNTIIRLGAGTSPDHLNLLVRSNVFHPDHRTAPILPLLLQYDALSDEQVIVALHYLLTDCAVAASRRHAALSLCKWAQQKRRLKSIAQLLIARVNDEAYPNALPNAYFFALRQLHHSQLAAAIATRLSTEVRGTHNLTHEADETKWYRVSMCVYIL